MDGTKRARLFFCRKNRSLKEPIPLNRARPGRNRQYIGLSGIFFFMPSFYIIKNREKQTFPAGNFCREKRGSGGEKRRKKTNEGKICFFSIIEI